MKNIIFDGFPKVENVSAVELEPGNTLLTAEGERVTIQSLTVTITFTDSETVTIPFDQEVTVVRGETR